MNSADASRPTRDEAIRAAAEIYVEEKIRLEIERRIQALTVSKLTEPA